MSPLETPPKTRLVTQPALKQHWHALKRHRHAEFLNGNTSFFVTCLGMKQPFKVDYLNSRVKLGNKELFGCPKIVP